MQDATQPEAVVIRGTSAQAGSAEPAFRGSRGGWMGGGRLAVEKRTTAMLCLSRVIGYKLLNSVNPDTH